MLYLNRIDTATGAATPKCFGIEEILPVQSAIVLKLVEIGKMQFPSEHYHILCFLLLRE